MKTLIVITREVETCWRAVPEPTRRAEWSRSVTTPACATWLMSPDVWGIVGCRLCVRGQEHAPHLCVWGGGGGWRWGGGGYSLYSPSWIDYCAHGRADDAQMEWNGSRSLQSKPQTGLDVAASVCCSSTGNLNCRLLVRQPWSAHGEQNRMLLLKRRKASCCRNKVWHRPNYSHCVTEEPSSTQISHCVTEEPSSTQISHCVTEEPSSTQISRQTFYRKVRTHVSNG